MKTPKKISTKLLRRLKACEDQVVLFRETFPDSHETGVTINLRNAKKAARAGLDLDWLAQTILPPPALKAYNEAIAPALKVYEEAIAAAWKAYNEARAAAGKVYNEAIAPAFVRAALGKEASTP